MEEVKRLCSSVLMMKDGLIVDRGTPERVNNKIWKKKLRGSIFRNCEKIKMNLIRIYGLF